MTAYRRCRLLRVFILVGLILIEHCRLRLLDALPQKLYPSLLLYACYEDGPAAPLSCVLFPELACHLLPALLLCAYLWAPLHLHYIQPSFPMNRIPDYLLELGGIQPLQSPSPRPSTLHNDLSSHPIVPNGNHSLEELSVDNGFATYLANPELPDKLAIVLPADPYPGHRLLGQIIGS
jgi:hypothetical protein